MRSGSLRFGWAIAVVLFALIGPGAASAATVTVDSLADDGTDCTLRDAVVSTNINADQPDCSHTGAYSAGTLDTVDITVTGELQLAASLVVDQTTGATTIDGPGPTDLVVRGDTTFRVITITAMGGGTPGPTTIDGMTITDGTAIDGIGGGIYNNGLQDLAVSNSVIRDNTSTQTTMTGSAIASGGGIYTVRGLTLDSSTVSDNHATATTSNGSPLNFATALGGGIASASTGTFTITGSTISGNDATGISGSPGSDYTQAYGGGISQSSLGTWSIRRSTISGNSAVGTVTSNGGGIVTGASGGTTFTGVTLAFNTATTGGANLNRGGGPADTFQSTIFSNPQGDFNCNTTGTSGGFNIESDSSCFTVNGINDQLDLPMISPTLAFNGGATKTHALLPMSPAIDKGSAFSLSNDQRGFTRTVDLSTYTNATGGDGTDVGAFELNDPDLDGLESYQDNCPNDANPGQANNDGDFEGDLCDLDDDNDGIDDAAPDNCPFTSNAGQANHDTDGQGDACDTDDDGDGVLDTSDACPIVAAATANGCPVVVTPPPAQQPVASSLPGPTGQQAAALKKCKKKKGAARKRCKKKALKLPV